MKTGSLALGPKRLERLVVLVDVQVFAQGNVNASQAYATLIHSCVEQLLTVCSEHSTGHKRRTSWGYKLFDSSLSPLASSSMIQKLLKAEQEHLGRYKSGEGNLGIFQLALCRLAAEVNSRSKDVCQQTRSNCEFIVKALQEVLSDFTWDSIFINDESSSDDDQARRGIGEFQGASPFSTQQNLVMVFSHLPDNMRQFLDFMNMPTSQDPTRDAEIFKTFSLKMKRLQEPFRLKGIHACWVDMPRLSTSLIDQRRGFHVSTGLDRKPERQELHAVFTQTKWTYTTMDALAIASDCIPLPLLWSSVAYPGLLVRPNAHKLRAKLRISVEGRDGTQLQPEVCRLEAVPLGSNIVGSALMKESVSAMLKLGSSSKAPSLFSVKCSSSQAPIIKIVVKSLTPKQNLSFKCTLRYLLHHVVECGVKTGVQKLDPLADDAASNIYGDDILQQLQQEPMSFDSGQRAWQLLLIAIARKKSVAEVDIYENGVCSSAVLEPITVQYAALLQKDQSSRTLSPDVNEQFSVPLNGSKSSNLLLKSAGDANLEGSECARFQQERKRPASNISWEEGPLVKREKMAGGHEQKPSCVEEINYTKRETYSWIQHWRHILRRKTVGTGKVLIENRYLRPGRGKKPSKAILSIKCWLDQVSTFKPLTAQQLIPSPPAVTEPDMGGKRDSGSSHLGASGRVGQADNQIVPLKRKELFSAVLDTKEQAETYLSSIEQMLQDCLESDAGDLQVFIKRIMSNATRAQQILLKGNRVKDLVSHLCEIVECPISNSDMQVHSSAQENIEKGEVNKPCNSDSSCNASKVEKVDQNIRTEHAAAQDLLSLVSGVTNGAMLHSNSIDYGGASDGADFGGQTAFIVHGVGTETNHETKDQSQANSDGALLSDLVANHLMDKFLAKPKKLARQYKECESASSDIVHIREEKLRAYELQILFRMELIERDSGGPLEKEKPKFLKEICRLLDDIQFDVGGVFGGESLHDYSIRVIYNRYKERLPQTVADIFERMEFNGYAEGVSELQPAPADLVGSHDQKEADREEVSDKFAMMDTATEPFIQTEQPVEEKGQRDTFHTSSKGPSKRGRKRSVPMDASTRAKEKRRLASRLAHFGGPDSHHRLKKIKIHNQSPRPRKVSNPVVDKCPSKEHNVVLETPRFERQKVRADTSKIADEDDEVDSAPVLASTFGFGTPARVSKHMQLATRKRRLALFTQKKPPGRGLPRIPLDVMKAMTEGEVLHPPAESDCQLDTEFLAHNDGAGKSNSMYVSQSTQEQRLPDPESQGQRSADILKDARTATFDPADLTGWILRVQGDQGKPAKNDLSSDITRLTGSETQGSAGQSHPLLLDEALENQIIQENSCHPVRVIPTQVSIHKQVLRDFNNGTLINVNMPIPSRRNRRKSVHTSKSRKPDSSTYHCSRAGDSTSVIQTISPERNYLGLGSAAQDPVQTLQLLDKAENPQPVDLASSENRCNEEEILYSSPTTCRAQHMLTAMQSNEMAGDLEQNDASASLEKRHEFLNTSHFMELISSPLPKTSFTKYPELGGDTGVLFATETEEEIRKRVTDSKQRTRSSKRALYENTLSLSPSNLPINWEMPCTDLNETQDFELVDRVGASQMSPTNDSLVSPRSWSLHTVSPFRINQTSKFCRVPSAPLRDELAAEDDVQLLKSLGIHTEDVDLDYSQVIKEIFQFSKTLDQADTEESRDEVGDYYDDLLELSGIWSPPPRLNPEGRLSTSYPTALQRKKVGLDEDMVAVVAGVSPIKFSSPTLNRKFRRPSEDSPGRYLTSPNAVVNCMKRPRSTSASPKENQIKTRRIL